MVRIKEHKFLSPSSRCCIFQIVSAAVKAVAQNLWKSLQGVGSQLCFFFLCFNVDLVP